MGTNDYKGHVFGKTKEDVYLAVCVVAIESLELSRKLFKEDAFLFKSVPDKEEQMRDFFAHMAQGDYEAAANDWFGYIEIEEVEASTVQTRKELDARLEKVYPELYAKSIKEKII